MLIDGRMLDVGAGLEADVCIVGAGPAGLAVAFELERGGAKTLVLAGTDDPLGGEVAGEPYPPLATTRTGGIGGTAPLWDAEIAPDTWGARYSPLAARDFEGWPFGRAALDPFYARAQDLCDAGPYEYEAAPPTGVAAGVACGLFRFGPADVFTERHRDRVARSESVRVVTRATAIRIHRDEDRAVTHIEASPAPGRSFRVAARAYVLAAGGIENARLLLLSTIGSEALVGRCFMDHPTIHCRLELTSPAPLDAGFFDVRAVANRPVLGYLTLPEQTLREEHLLNGGFFLVPAADRELKAKAAARTLVHAARSRHVPERPFNRVAEMLAGIDTLGLAAHRKVVRSVPALGPTLRVWRRSKLLNTLGLGPVSGWSSLGSRPTTFDVYHVIEQAPDPERRVTLGTSRDSFGLPQAKLHWFIGTRELESAERTEQILGHGLRTAGIGRLATARELTDDLAAAAAPSAHHHLGTTRMHIDPERGVVDADGRVHGLSNLFVTGGSVFPTSGFTNPTLTIVALATRLGAHLRQDVLG